MPKPLNSRLNEEQVTQVEQAKRKDKREEARQQGQPGAMPVTSSLAADLSERNMGIWRLFAAN